MVIIREYNALYEISPMAAALLISSCKVVYCLYILSAEDHVYCI